MGQSSYQKVMNRVAVAGPDECWEWIIKIHRPRNPRKNDKFNYPQIQIDGRNRKAHRVVLEHELGRPIADGLFACHSCDNPVCLNPKHLFEGTPNDNVQDAISKNRHAHGEKIPQNKLGEKGARRIWEMALSGSYTQTEIAQEAGISPSCVSEIVNRKSWSHLAPADGINPIFRDCESERRAKLSNATRRWMAENGPPVVPPENRQRGEKNWNSVLTEEAVLEIRRRCVGGSESAMSVARDFGVDEATVLQISTGRTWRHVGGPTRPTRLTKVLDEDAVIRLRERYAQGGVKHSQLAAEFGISQAAVSRCVSGNSYKEFGGPLTAGRLGSPGSSNAAAKLNEEDVGIIRERYASGSVSQNQLAREYSVKQSTIWQIVTGRSWVAALNQGAR